MENKYIDYYPARDKPDANVMEPHFLGKIRGLCTFLMHLFGSVSRGLFMALELLGIILVVSTLWSLYSAVNTATNVETWQALGNLGCGTPGLNVLCTDYSASVRSVDPSKTYPVSIMSLTDVEYIWEIHELAREKALHYHWQLADVALPPDIGGPDYRASILNKRDKINDMFANFVNLGELRLDVFIYVAQSKPINNLLKTSPVYESTHWWTSYKKWLKLPTWIFSVFLANEPKHTLSFRHKSLTDEIFKPFLETSTRAYDEMKALMIEINGNMTDPICEWSREVAKEAAACISHFLISDRIPQFSRRQDEPKIIRRIDSEYQYTAYIHGSSHGICGIVTSDNEENQARLHQLQETIDWLKRIIPQLDTFGQEIDKKDSKLLSDSAVAHEADFLNLARDCLIRLSKYTQEW